MCLEEGYFRTGYVTIEEGGNNASSPIAGKVPNFEEVDFPETLDEERLLQITENSFRNKCWYGFYITFLVNYFLLKNKKIIAQAVKFIGSSLWMDENFLFWKLFRRKMKSYFMS